jgi:carbon-monoxide dehydrogenase large subunit
MGTALDPKTPVIHSSLGDNLAFERTLDAGTVDAAFASSDEIVEAEFIFGRRDSGAACGGCGLEPGGGAADDLSGHAGPAHGAEHRSSSSQP